METLSSADAEATSRISFGDRWRRARRDTRGFRAWKRQLLGALVAGALTYAALSRYGSWQSARDELIATVVAMLATVVLLPCLEFVWNFARAPLAIAQDEIQRLVKEMEVLKRQLEAASGWKGIARTRLQEFWKRGAELRQRVLESTDESELAHQRFWTEFAQWREELLDYLHSLSPSKASYVDEVKVVGTPLSYAGRPLVEWKQNLVKQIDSRVERLRIVMQDYPTGLRAELESG